VLPETGAAVVKVPDAEVAAEGIGATGAA